MYIEPLKFLLWAIACVATVAVVLFFIGRAYESSKMRDLRAELRRLRKQNEVGKNANFKRAKRLAPLKKNQASPKYEILTQGSPKDA